MAPARLTADTATATRTTSIERLGMDEHDPQAPHVDTPAPDTPDQGTGTDWESRYKEAQAWGTRASQEASQLQQQLSDPEYQRQLMAQWGYEVEEDAQPDQEWVDPTDELREKLAELEQWKNERTEAEQALARFESDAEHIGLGLQEFEKTIGRELDPEEVRLLGDAAFNRRGDDGKPDIASVIETMSGIRVRDQQHWEESRKRPRAPHVPPGGQQGTSAPNLDDRQARRDHMAEQLAAMESQQ
jgi:hypothetical protein